MELGLPKGQPTRFEKLRTLRDQINHLLEDIRVCAFRYSAEQMENSMD